MNLQPLFRLSQFMNAVMRIRNAPGAWKITYGPGYHSVIGASGVVDGQQIADDLTLADVENFLSLADTFWECREQSRNAAGVNLTNLQRELAAMKEALAHPEKINAEELRRRVILCQTLARAVVHYRATDRSAVTKTGK